MNILALDLSLTNTGICKPDGSTLSLPTGKMRGMERLKYIRGRVMYFAHDCDLAVLEGYAMGARGNSIYNIGELGGIVRLALFEMNIPVVEIPPSNVKRYATGKGVADKDRMVSLATLQAGREFTNDEADAWFIHQMALAHYDPDNPLLVKMPKANLEGLAKVPWVELGKAVAA